MNAKTRVLVVEDSLTVRTRICETLATDPDLEIVAEAEDGKRAIELCQLLRPDVLTLDMMLPIMTGLAATEYIMAHFPTPILIVSASTNRGELFRTYDALAAGAVDVLEKPTGHEPAGHWESQLIAAVKLVARIKVITHPRARLGALGIRSDTSAPVPETAAAAGGRLSIIGIGTSTGGPAAIIEALRLLPSDFPVPILLVIHIGQPFGTAFAEWLDNELDVKVAFPRDNERVDGPDGRVFIAPPDSHLVVCAGRMRLTDDPPRHSCRPSVDLLFESIAREYGAESAGFLLTGMGRDGAAGLLDMRRAGAYTVAQDEKSCVVYGMPREAVLLGAAERVLPLSEIGAHLRDLARVKTGKPR